MLGVYAAAGVSGAHLNPAVTIALAVRAGFPWSKVPAYIAAQMAGAFVASAVVFLTYREAFAAFDGGVRQVQGDQGTAGIFATYPQPFLSIGGGFVDQVVGTALLMAGVLALTDQRNAGPPAWLAGAARWRPGRGDRRGVRLQRRLCDQPGARFRAAAVHRGGRLGWRRVHGRRRLVVGAGRRPDDRRASSARWSTTCASAASCRRAERER